MTAGQASPAVTAGHGFAGHDGGTSFACHDRGTSFACRDGGTSFAGHDGGDLALVNFKGGWYEVSNSAAFIRTFRTVRLVIQ